MAMVSYAQNGEDVLLNRVFGGKSRGLYIDVGANDPTLHSVTRHFYEQGWRGINIEPERRVFARLERERAGEVNLNVGLAEQPGALRFYEAVSACGWSTFSPEHAAELRRRGLEVAEYVVPVMTLAEVCERHVGDRAIDFLKIDAEGFERAVIAGGDWTRWRPKVVLVEAHAVEAWERLLLGVSYRFTFFDGINRFYVSEEASELGERLATPANATDDFVPHVYLSRIRDLEGRLAELGDVGPTAMRVARWITRSAAQHPRLARLARGLTRLAG